MSQTRNALGNETSPYLRQHQHNPVHWYPWGKEALLLAHDLKRPILLSIGYSACHWCHVMAHESFEDDETAGLMNTLFINIKVDREERPDLDKIYQTAHQLLVQRPGGWPLTMFLTADRHIPFFGGTYFPGEERHNLPAFKDILRRVAGVYQDHHHELQQQNQAIVTALQDLSSAHANTDAVLNPIPIDAARRQLEQRFDPRHGGFGRAPKFPHPTHLEGLLRHWASSGDIRSKEMALFTLHKMALGGIYDQLGGGFCRYSVDDGWVIPHFEKMLYDNGPLLTLYAQAWQASGEPLFRQVANATADWVMREMQSTGGGYYSSQDADSEGEEGRFYAWTPGQVKALLNDGDYRLLARHYGLDREANFESRWNLHIRVDQHALADEFELGKKELDQRLDAARNTLFQAREQRVRPARDEKVLTAWNGLMIKGMAVAGRILQRPELINSACHAVDFIHAQLWQDGRLFASYKDGQAHLNGYLDDYAFLLDGLLELLQARWRNKDLYFAIALAEALLEHFEDKQNGGFFFTADDHEVLIQRPKPFGDESLPAGNGIAAYALGRLGHLLGEQRYLSATERTLKSAWPAIEHLPYAHNTLIVGVGGKPLPATHRHAARCRGGTGGLATDRVSGLRPPATGGGHPCRGRGAARCAGKATR